MVVPADLDPCACQRLHLEPAALVVGFLVRLLVLYPPSELFVALFRRKVCRDFSGAEGDEAGSRNEDQAYGKRPRPSRRGDSLSSAAAVAGS